MVLTEDTVAARLKKVDNTQDGIQTMSLWMLHYKDTNSVSTIVSSWLNVFRTSNEDQRVNLFYVVNDVVLRARRKNNNDTLVSAFHNPIVQAISIGRTSDVVRRAMARCISIFEEKGAFPPTVLEECKKALEDIPDGEDIDFDQSVLHQDIEAYRKGDAVMEKARGILARSEFAFANEIPTRMKDRKEGQKLVNEVAAAVKKLEDFSNTVKSHRQRCLNLIDMVENAKRAFATQLRDVTIVEDAYQKFYSGIKDVRTELEDMMKSGVYPGASPPMDAPSPTANEDIYAGGVEKVLQSMQAPGARDNLETADMDMDDDDVGVGSTVAAANARLAASQAHAAQAPPPNFIPLPAGSNFPGAANGAPPPSTIPMPPLNVTTAGPVVWPGVMSPSPTSSQPQRSGGSAGAAPSTPVTSASGMPPPIFSPNPFNANFPPPPGASFTTPPPLYSPSMPNWPPNAGFPPPNFTPMPNNQQFSQPPPHDGNNFDGPPGEFRRNSYGGGGGRGGRGNFRGDFRGGRGGGGGFPGRRNTADGRFDGPPRGSFRGGY